MTKAQSVVVPVTDNESTDAALKASSARRKHKAGSVPHARAATHQPSQPQTRSKLILKLLRRKKGASLAELQDATGWQAHSIRGFLSGTVRKRLELPLKTIQSEKGDRRYLLVEA